MSAQNIPLIQAVAIAAANTKYYQATGDVRIDAMAVFNPTGNAAEVVTISIVPSGGTPGATNPLWTRNCLPGVPYIVDSVVGQSLHAGDQIWAQGTAGALVNLFASGLLTS